MHRCWLLLSGLPCAAGAFGAVFSVRRGVELDIFAGVGSAPAFYLSGAGGGAGFVAVSLQMNTVVGPSAGVRITPHVVSSTPSHASLPKPHGAAFVASDSAYFGVTGFLNSDVVSYRGGKVATLEFGDEATAAAARIDHSSERTAIEMPGDLLGWSTLQAGPATLLVLANTGGGEVRAFTAAPEVDRIEVVWAKPPAFFTKLALGSSQALLANGLALSLNVTAEGGNRTRIVVQSGVSDANCPGQPSPFPVTEALALPLKYADVLRPSDVVSATVLSKSVTGGCQGVPLDTVIVFAERSELWSTPPDNKGPFSTCV
jgi:hypothetical protein